MFKQVLKDREGRIAVNGRFLSCSPYNRLILKLIKLTNWLDYNTLINSLKGHLNSKLNFTAFFFG